MVRFGEKRGVHLYGIFTWRRSPRTHQATLSITSSPNCIIRYTRPVYAYNDSIIIMVQKICRTNLYNLYKCVNHTAPDYLSTIFSLYRPVRSGLRSATDSTKLVEHSIIRTLKSADSRSIFYTGPRIWNKLPVSMRESDTLSKFKRALKTYFYPN